MTRTLRLALKKEYFEAIRAGSKLEEYRLMTPYWITRLQGQTFDKIVLTWGYPKSGDTTRQIERKWNGYEMKTITHKHFGNVPHIVFAIDVSVSL